MAALVRAQYLALLDWALLAGHPPPQWRAFQVYYRERFESTSIKGLPPYEQVYADVTKMCESQHNERRSAGGTGYLGHLLLGCVRQRRAAQGLG